MSTSRHHYRPRMKLREGNVFKPICQSFCLQGEGRVSQHALGWGMYPSMLLGRDVYIMLYLGWGCGCMCVQVWVSRQWVWIGVCGQGGVVRDVWTGGVRPGGSVSRGCGQGGVHPCHTPEKAH